MKAYLLASVLYLSGGAAAFGQEEIESKEVVVHDVEHTLNIALNDQTVLCSDADYSANLLKILIPDLKNLTLFNHRNYNAAAPCVAAGMCRGPLAPNGPQPSDILNPSKPTEEVKLRVKLTRYEVINHKEKTCETHLIENLTVPIRGLSFTHQREGSLDYRNYEDCL